MERKRIHRCMIKQIKKERERERDQRVTFIRERKNTHIYG